jgi:lysophospholipase L1-like esterase
MRKSWMITISFVSVLATLCFITGFSLGVKEVLLPQTTPQQIYHTDDDQIDVSKEGLLLGLGDSLTRGIGDTDGKGYLVRVKEKLEKMDQSQLSLINLAVSGQISSQLVTKVKEPQVQALIKQAKWITITIGSNDLFRSNGRQVETIDLAATKKSLISYQQNLTQILTSLRSQNQTAKIILLGIYNPFSGLENEKMTSQLVADWNRAILQVTANYKNVIVVPTFDLFQVHNQKYLSSDHFHPNDIGYQRVADRIYQVIHD